MIDIAKAPTLFFTLRPSVFPGLHSIMKKAPFGENRGTFFEFRGPGINFNAFFPGCPGEENKKSSFTKGGIVFVRPGKPASSWRTNSLVPQSPGQHQQKGNAPFIFHFIIVYPGLQILVIGWAIVPVVFFRRNAPCIVSQHPG